MIKTSISLDLLTKTEKRILTQISLGLTSKEIVEQEVVSIRTIEKHRSHIIEKLNIPKNTNGLTRWALINADKL